MIQNYHPNFCHPTSFIFALLWFNPDNQWKIHGLWPETCEECQNCGYPSYCRPKTTHFNETVLNSLGSLIRKLWYPGKTLIEHEWMKHGSCDGDINEFDYFNTTLSLRNCINVSSRCNSYIQSNECQILLYPQDIKNCLSQQIHPPFLLFLQNRTSPQLQPHSLPKHLEPRTGEPTYDSYIRVFKPKPKE